jgi:hypothetical protein
VESLNVHIFVAVLSVVAFVLVFVGIGVVLLALLGLHHLIGVIMGTVAASQGREFRYPVTVGLVRWTTNGPTPRGTGPSWTSVSGARPGGRRCRPRWTRRWRRRSPG